MKLEYRNNDYFNDQDYFLMKSNLGLWRVTKLAKHGARWYSLNGLSYYMDTVESQNTKELLGAEVVVLEVFKGKLTQVTSDALGVTMYHQPDSVREHKGLPNFWNEPKNVVFL